MEKLTYIKWEYYKRWECITFARYKWPQVRMHLREMWYGFYEYNRLPEIISGDVDWDYIITDSEVYNISALPIATIKKIIEHYPPPK